MHGFVSAIARSVTSWLMNPQVRLSPSKHYRICRQLNGGTRVDAAVLEPWSIIAELPTGEPYGILMQLDVSHERANLIMQQLLATWYLTGMFFPCGKDSENNPTYGLYLLTYTLFNPNNRDALASIWAESFADARHRLNILAAHGVLCTLTHDG